MGNMMQGFLMNNKVYEIQANNQIASLLAQFDADYIMEIIDDTLDQVFTRFDLIPRPNIVRSFDTTFKELYEIYPSDINNINEIRIQTYQNIINHICQRYALRFIQTDHVDLFTIADILYDFFISNLNNYMVQFYVKLILDEKESLINVVNIDEIKKSKDPNIVYNRMAFGDNDKMIVIAINLPIILRHLSTLQLTDHTIYQYIYSNRPEVIELIENSISPTVPIFTRFNEIIFNDALYGPIVTYIRMALQQYVSDIK